MKTNISKFSLLFVIFLLIIFKNITIAQGTYFHDADFVYLTVNELTNPIPALGEKRTLYWDLSNIDTTNNNNRLDLCVGQNQIYPGPLTDYLIGNWFRNEINSNFNNENPNLRFINNTFFQIVDSITGLAFISLRENSKRDLVVLRGSGEMEIRQNKFSFIQISGYSTISNVYGKMPVTGKFTNDTLEDLAVNSPIGIRIFIGTGGSFPTLEENFNLLGYVFKRIYLAQINKHFGPLAVINNEISDRDEIIAQYGNNILIFKNNNNNTTPSTPETTISFSDFLSDFKVADLNNDGYNDIIAITQYYVDYTTYGEVSIFLNNNGTISNTPI